MNKNHKGMLVLRYRHSFFVPGNPIPKFMERTQDYVKRLIDIRQQFPLRQDSPLIVEYLISENSQTVLEHFLALILTEN